MSEYVSDFGVTRVLGVDEGRSLKNESANVVDPVIKLKVVLSEANEAPDANVEGTSFGKGIAYIPAGAYIISAKAFNAKAVAGATIGTYKKDGTEIDADGLVGGVNAGVTTGAGALVGTVAAEDSYIKASGTLTDLDGFLIVEYAL